MTRGLALRIWIGFAIALAVKYLVENQAHSVYPCFANASVHWWKGWSMFDRRVMPYDYRYSPSFAVLFSLFAYIPTPWGGLLWAEFNLCALWIGLQGLIQRILPVSWTDRQIGWFLTLSLLGTARSLWPGQCNLLILSMGIAALVLIQNRRWWWGGLFLVAPIFIKVWPAALLLLCLPLYPKRLPMPVIVWTIVLAIFPFLTQKYFYVRSEYHEWYLAMVGPISVRTTSYDAWALWEVIHRPVSNIGYSVLQITTGGILFLAVIWKKLGGVSIRAQHAFLLWGWTSWQVLFGPGVERMTLGIVAPLSAWVVLEAWPCIRSRVPAIMGFVLTQIAVNVNFERGGWQSTYWFLLHPVGMVLLWIAFAIRSATEEEMSFDQD